MSADDAVPDRDHLRDTAARRARHGRLAATVVLTAVLVLIPVAVLAVTGPPYTGGEVLLAFTPSAVGLLIASVVTWWVRRHEPRPALATGADRNTRRAVQRALRTGRADNARIDALAREAADRTMRHKWLMILYAVLAVLQLALTIIRIADRDVGWQIAVSVVTTALFAVAAVVLWVTRRRSRRYLRSVANNG